MLTYKIKLVVGDWSDDGHGKTDSYLVKTNYSAADIKRSYERVLKTHKLRAPCNDCEDNRVDINIVELLAQHNIKTSDILEYDKKNETYSFVDCGQDYFSELYLRISSVILTDLVYEFIDSDIATLNVGGYGLFY